MLRRARADDGSILPLIAGYGALALLVVLLVTAATSLYLERTRLLTLADGAALAGAEAFALDDLVVEGGQVVRPRLDDAEVRAAVEQYLSEAPIERFEGLKLERAESDDTVSATVALSSFWRPPVVTLFVPEGIRLEVTAVGRSVFG